MLCNGKVQTALTFSVIILLLGSYLVFEAPTAKAAVTKVIWSTNTSLSGEFVVTADQELVIMPDVTITLGLGTNITILGNLTAIGTPSQPIHFVPLVDGNLWGMLNFTYSARSSHLAYCHIEGATTALYGFQTQLYVDRSNISRNLLDGIHATDTMVQITNSTFRMNGLGQPLIQAGIYLNHASGLVDNNTLSENNHGIYLKEGSTAKVSNNQVLGSVCSQCSGIKVRSGSNPIVENNTLTGNFAGFIGNNSVSTLRNNNITYNLDDGILLVNHDSSLVQDNQITHNSDDGLEANSGSTPNLVHNDFWHNSDDGVNIINATVNMTTSTLHENPYGVEIDSKGRLNSSSNFFTSNVNDGIAAWWDANLTSINDKFDSNGDTGILMAGTNSTLKNPTILSNKRGLRIVDRSEVYIEDGYSKLSQNGELEIDNMAHVTTLNFTRWNQTVKYSGNDARLRVKWYLTVKVVNQAGVPLQGVNVTITPNGFPKFNGTTNSLGSTGRQVFTEFNKTYMWGSTTETYWSPYHITASFKGATNSTDINLTSTKEITLTLFIVNNPPVLAVPLGNYSFNEDTTAFGLVNCSEHFTDESSLVYDLVMQSDPTKVLGKVNGSKLDFFTPTKDWNGVQKFQVRANDSEGVTTLSNVFNVTVLPINDPPVLLPLADLFSTVDETVSSTLKATDVDDPPSHFLFKCDDAPPSGIALTLDAHSGVFTFKSNRTGNFTLHFSVTDGALSSNIISVNFTVTDMNTPPQFTSKDIVSAYLGSTYRYKITAYDPDGDPMNLTLVDWPHGMTLVGWNLTWSPDASQLGQNQVGLSLTDGKHVPVLHYFNITVYLENHPPTPKILSPSTTGATFYEGTSIHFKGNATDPDKDNLSYTWRIDGSVVSTLLEFNTSLTRGTHQISFAASDGSVSAYANTTLLIKVRATIKPYKTYLDNMCLLLAITVVAVCIVSDIVYRRFKH
jgi:parallel beta-helix repeat protein